MQSASYRTLLFSYIRHFAAVTIVTFPNSFDLVYRRKESATDLTPTNSPALKDRASRFTATSGGDNSHYNSEPTSLNRRTRRQLTEDHITQSDNQTPSKLTASNWWVSFNGPWIFFIRCAPFSGRIGLAFNSHCSVNTPKEWDPKCLLPDWGFRLVHPSLLFIRGQFVIVKLETYCSDQGSFL